MAKTLVLGAGGILGQHMLIERPSATFVRQHVCPLYQSCDLTDPAQLSDLLTRFAPDVIVNLAGENRVDVVQADPNAYRSINVALPHQLAAWCDTNRAHLIHVSSQGIFSGQHAPYGAGDQPHPITSYGEQKAEAEFLVAQHHRWSIARVTFVLGVRPFPGLGRVNPLEAMFSTTGTQRQVDDRWFSPSFASDVAHQLWTMADNHHAHGITHLGVPIRTTRYQLALQAAPDADVEAVTDDEFPGTSRPLDSSWSSVALAGDDITTGIEMAAHSWRSRRDLDVDYRAREIALFFHQVPGQVAQRLAEGFQANHHRVAEDFRSAAPGDDDALLAWYTDTDAYVWELSAYHLDAGFNYKGMCAGVAERLTAWGKPDALILGDGIGDLTMTLKASGLRPVYHDLRGSVTANFAQFRFNLAFPGDTPTLWTDRWHAEFGTECWDAIVALDFFEHLTEVEGWVRAAYRSLRHGGFFMAQNAFACGDIEHGGSIPMHLVRNNRYEKDWTPLLEEIGFIHDVTEWWVKP